jgi:glycosyltransferase involved in cell wall biosynthesis
MMRPKTTSQSARRVEHANHEAYCGETLESFVAEKRRFPVELIVADGASTDAMPGIIQETFRSVPQHTTPSRWAICWKRRVRRGAEPLRSPSGKFPDSKTWDD